MSYSFLEIEIDALSVIMILTDLLSGIDEDFVLSLLAIGIIAVRRHSRLLFIDGLRRLQLSDWLVMLLLLEPSCNLKMKVAYLSGSVMRRLCCCPSYSA